MYIIQNPAGGYYIGHTDDLEQRIHFHNTGQSHYTARKGPWTLVHSETFAARSEAAKREGQIKGWKSKVMIKRLIAASSG